MLVIVEGPDRAGKSTVVDAITQQLHRQYPNDLVTVLHAGPPEKHPLDEYERPLFTYHPMQQQHIICDRWHIGELVYPAVFQRPTQFTQPVQAHVEAFLRSRGALLVHVDAYPSALITRLDAEERIHPGKSLVDRGQLLESRDHFTRVTRLSTLSYVYVDATYATPLYTENVVRHIIRQADTLEHDACALTEFKTYVGSPHPTVLLIGDVRHEHRYIHATTDTLKNAQLDPTPAFMPYPATSGEYLLRSIEPLLRQSKVGLINANDVDDPYLAWKTLGEPQVVALGRRAYSTVKTWTHGAVPHPQFIRRFYSKHTTWYDLTVQLASTGVNLLGTRPGDAYDGYEEK